MALDMLVVGPHPDDVELACGGTIITHTDKNYRVGIVDLTDAAMSTRGAPDTRAHEADTAANLMGVTERIRLGFKEGALECKVENLYPLVSVIRSTKPQVVLAPYWDDRHPDHGDTSRLVQNACFWAGVPKYGDNQHPHRPQRVLFYFLHWMGPVSMVVDISNTFDRKLAAIRAYHSQFYARPGDSAFTYISRPEFLEKVINRARYYGGLIGAEYGEPFHVRDMHREPDLIEWVNRQGLTG